MNDLPVSSQQQQQSYDTQDGNFYKNDTPVPHYKQVEVSHGSTSNLTAMYETNEDNDTSNFSFCCDVLIIFVVFGVCIFVMLFWYDHVPGLDDYFRNQQHRRDKKIIVGLSVVLIIGLTILLIVRLLKRAKCMCCCHSIKSILLGGRMKDSFDSGIMSDDIYDSSVSFETKHNSSINLKLNELSDTEHSDLRRIMILFLNYHEDNDWILSPSSSSSTTSPTKLGKSPNSNLSSVKIKFTVKLVLVGSPSVGKTSIFHRILYDSFTEYYMATLGADIGLTTFHIFPNETNNHVKINLQLWDISGSETFTDLARIVYKDSTALLLVCDASNSDVVASLLPWIHDINSLVFDPYVALLCNKIDADIDQRSSDVRLYHSDLEKFDLYKVSAKTGEMVVENVIRIIVSSVFHELNKLM